MYFGEFLYLITFCPKKNVLIFWCDDIYKHDNECDVAHKQEEIEMTQMTKKKII